MLTGEGYVAECTGDNIFHVTGGTIFTPSVFHGALRGVTREVVIDLARTAGIEVCETTVTRYDLFTADECFLTGTGAEIIPVRCIDSRIIGSGKPGPVTLDLIRCFRALVGSEGTSIR
jgi:branched-chain amino acid aminotransferase